MAALAFLASLLAHELAHALTARRYQVPVQRITLWMLGGVSVLDGDPATPRAAFLIAAAGPATSLCIGAVSGAGGLLLRVTEAPDLLQATALWFAVMNVALGLFNLLPGVPLDGGRVLRAWLWHRYGDPDRATAVASVAGLVVGGLIAVGGVVQLVTGDAGGVWLMAVGYVVALAATAEGRQARARARGERFVAGAVMRPVVEVGDAAMPVSRFLTDVAPGTEQLVFPVVGPGGRTTGVVSLARLVAVPLELRSGTLLRDIQTPVERIQVVDPRTPLTELQHLAPDDVALVVDGARLAGLITGYDVAHRTGCSW
ncbi:site-2 protease family protein [Kribbella sp. NPDC048928]|uniref:site-2 protease family protein n=1 Tax=Kribbella sp. NPDC048928 TaxID=3364111 RepID=UPI003719A0DA